MVQKEGIDGEEEARRAYKAAREDTDQAAELTLGRKVSSALINRVTWFFIITVFHEFILVSWWDPHLTV